MKARHILLLLVCFQALFSQAQIRETKLEETTFYFIRHAEKDRSTPNDRNPGLTPTNFGIKLAKEFAKDLGKF